MDGYSERGIVEIDLILMDIVMPEVDGIEACRNVKKREWLVDVPVIMVTATMTLKLLIAMDLHDLGKLAISNNLLDKPGNLSIQEYEEIQKHPNITRLCLQSIKGFEKITMWASNHHEKLDGSGYPQGLKAQDLDFNSRLVTCLDIYQALREERPYRKSMDHIKAMIILRNIVEVGQLARKIVDDINFVFSNLKRI